MVKNRMDEKLRKIILENMKDIKRDKGAILDDIIVDQVKKKFIMLSDDDLLITMTAKFGEFASYLRSTDDAMSAYGLAASYFLAEEEAKARNLYP
jgi:hypothetical protein